MVESKGRSLHFLKMKCLQASHIKKNAAGNVILKATVDSIDRRPHFYNEWILQQEAHIFCKKGVAF